ncbi:hypothetical protein [Streptomyces chromofuscus]|uniref:Uncharacterized protein n=1 Tax=Streptomyces chromofuscus TaxID=42881 RepID=A0A7M2TFY6_STRCW|nr:hypothetical protein [Streptomyces chromofuscus]QOV47392.1 hypothetical protein IPT68_00610 [Streptomyces chromofuscus]
MFQETPIFSRLVAERGDIPAQVRGEAERIRRDLARVLPQAPPAPHPSTAHNTGGWMAPPALP